LHEKRPRKLDSHLNNVLTWRQARRLLELAVKMEWTDGSSSSEIYKSNRLADVRLDEVDNAAHLVAGQCAFRQIYVRSKRGWQDYECQTYTLLRLRGRERDFDLRCGGHCEG